MFWGIRWAGPIRRLALRVTGAGVALCVPYVVSTDAVVDMARAGSNA